MEIRTFVLPRETRDTVVSLNGFNVSLVARVNPSGIVVSPLRVEGKSRYSLGVGTVDRNVAESIAMRFEVDLVGNEASQFFF